MPTRLKSDLTDVVTRPDGTREWYCRGRFHREDGPAIEWADGASEWYWKGQLHRDDGPAVEHAYGFQAWYRNGKRHREDGPVWPDGREQWFLDGTEVAREDVRTPTAFK